MNEQPELRFRNTLEDIRLYFEFLFDRGFRITSILFPDQNGENWQVSLLEGNCFVHIYSQQGVINLTMSTLQRAHDVIFFDLGSPNNNRDLFYRLDDFSIDESQQFQKIAHFLEKHLVEILAQAKKENFHFISHSLNELPAQQKRTITQK